ncbi:MAG: helix-turn-helix domain-containing protein [Eubacterium sp.]|nr:helix-turn-helix domain-containing protein [Eubacterium sp.]
MPPMIDYEKTGNRIKFLMNINDITPKDVQEYIGLSCVQTIYHWMNGVSIPKLEHLYMLSGLMNVEMDAMICGDRDQHIDKEKKEKIMKIIELMF